MAGSNCRLDKDYLSTVSQKISKLTINRNSKLKDSSNDEVTTLLNELIVFFHERQKEADLSIDAQVRIVAEFFKENF